MPILGDMAVAQFYAWERDGRPITPATPIREFVERMRVQFPRDKFSWYANDAHYEANFPQDHTPFSYTGWPVSNPYPYVFATDVMHHPNLGVNCFTLFNYWLSEAKAGRMPWLKYLIWQGRIYDVRNQWRAQSAVGHFDHVHLSARTDHQFTRLGTWSVVPKPPSQVEEDMPMYVIERRSDGVELVWASTGTHRWHVLDMSQVMLALNIPFPTQKVTTKQLVEGFGVEVSATDSPLTPDQLAQVTTAAHTGAEHGVDAAFDGATITTTIDTTD